MLEHFRWNRCWLAFVPPDLLQSHPFTLSWRLVWIPLHSQCPRRSRRMTHLCSSKIVQPRNTNLGCSSSSTPEACHSFQVDAGSTLFGARQTHAFGARHVD